MTSKKPKIEDKIGVIFKDTKELEDDLFDINITRGLVNISIERLTPNPNQPRKTFYEETITELAESIREQGLLSPIIVRPDGNKYQIIAGERRYKAAQQAGLKEVPALIRKVSDGEARIISLIENIQREDLNDIDRASALRELKVNLGLPWEKLAQKLGLTKQRVLDLVGLLDLPEEIKEDIRQKKITEKHGRALRQLLDQAEVLRDVFNFLKEKKLTGDESLELVRFVKSKPGFTVKYLFDQFEKDKQPSLKKTKEPLESAIGDIERFTMTIGKIKPSNIPKDKRKKLIDLILKAKTTLEELMVRLKNE
jgi:ParB family chromosome partitioning protein